MAVDLDLDLTTAVHRYLSAQEELTDLLGADDGAGGYPTWIFRWKSYRTVEGSGDAAIVLSQRPGSPSSAYHTSNFPRLQVEIYVDRLRDAQANPVNHTPEDRCNRIFRVLDRLLHTSPAGGDRIWGDNGSGGLRILSSQRDQDIDIVPVPDGDGMVRGLVSYSISLG